MPYYHDLVTKSSWQELAHLTHSLEFTLIGGWAVYLYTHSLKSKDIDILIDYDQLPILDKNYELIKNNRLHKYEAIKGPVQIDIYLPHYSKIGIPIQDLLQHTQIVNGFTTLTPDYLLTLKLHTLQERGRSHKGRKDLLDTISLINSLGLDLLSQAIPISHQYKLDSSLSFLTTILQENTNLPELSLNTHTFARLKKSILTQTTQSPQS